MDIPQTMLVSKAYDYDKFVLEEMETPRPGPREALVKVHALGVCTGDVTPWYVHKKCPTVLGHEPAGEIAALGSEVTHLKVGDRVYFHHHAPCGTCHYCRHGNYSMCSVWRQAKLVPGGAAQYCLVPENNLYKDTWVLPDTMSYDDATLIEPVACVVRAFRRALMTPGDTVAVMGLGVMGQMMVILAKYYGAKCVVASDKVPYRLEKAKSFGLDRAVDFTKESFPKAVFEATEGRGADIVMVCPTNAAAMLEGIECAGRASRVLMFMGPKPGTPMTVDMNKIYFDEIDLISSYSSGPRESREAMWLINEGYCTAKQLVTHRFPLSRMQEAVELTRKAGESLKVLIDIAH